MSVLFHLRIESVEKEILIKPEETILEALSRDFFGRDGEPVFMGCRGGGCATCKMELLSGFVSHSDTYSRSGLTDEERDRKQILACQSKPLSSLVIRRVIQENQGLGYFHRERE